MDDVKISSMKYPDESGGMTLVAKHPAFAALMTESVRLFKEAGGVNYVEWTLDSNDPAFGMFSIIIQRRSGKTPAERATEYRTALEKILNARASGCSTGEAMSKVECWTREALGTQNSDGRVSAE